MVFVDGKHLPVVALTGTNGKTTTKELVRAVLSSKYNVTATEGNLNNSIGVPLTLLKVNADTQIAVVEMGASHPGDIKELVDIALPDYGLITNVGKAHLLGFGSFEGVKATKGELYDYLRRTADKAFINVDNPHLCQMASERNMQHDPEREDSLLIPYGLEYQGAKVLPASEEHPFLRIELDGITINTNLVGSYNADNVMAAIAVGKQFGVTLEEAVKAIEAYVPSNNRSQMTKTSKNTLIVDAYNANPTSMAAALENFSNVAAECKVAMLGDMLELGEDSLAEHVAVVRSVAARGFAATYFVGKEFTAASAEMAAEQLAGMRFFATSDELAQHLTEHPLEGATVLIKGSRGTRMEKVIPVL
jgi:UDP-N-acetylmuramoyl-tripeptide--D-alanyl-D-alanine ligase